MDKLSDTLRVLIVEDSPDDLNLLLSYLRRDLGHIEFRQVMNAQDLERNLRDHAWDIVISDYNLPTFSGPEALRTVRAMSAEIPFILVSGTISDEAAVGTIKAGANDYVLKDNLIRLAPAIRREIADLKERQKLERELRKKEEIIRQTQKMEALGALTGGIVHDFNNFLAVVMIAADVAKSELEAGHPIYPVIEQIQVASDRAAALTRQLLTFYRKQIITIQNVELNQAVRQSETLLTRLLPEEVTFDVEFAPEELHVRIDPTQLAQVLLNIVVNAKDAMPDGGALKVRTFSQAGQVGFQVSDTGIGMSEDTRHQIFEPFFTTKGPERGTGIGLSTVMSILNDAKGRIEVDSVEGRGTTFTVLFPRADARAVEAAAQSLIEPSLRPGTETVLLVDDDRDIREMMEGILIRQGYNVLVAASPEQAIKIATEFPLGIDLLLTDLAMPRMDGLELSVQVSQIKTNIRVLYVTGYFNRELFARRKVQAANRVLQKPFSGTALLEKVRATLDADA